MKHESTSMQQLISNWLSQIGDVIGIKLELRPDGHAELICSENTCITIETDPERGYVYFYSKIIELPKGAKEREPYYRHALELNAFSFSLGGASISLDPRSNSIVLTFMETIKEMNADQL
ncbi:CesT family type III secretion system chaperone [Shewanella surugensis]|uniref:CesT family type III secretion system chaperone n=1 Tax=Shewanella surugensis TaxID=212020 RepID=A0ABT0LJG3_9GAMM|nr:CesT family type III secretion system chaperone [Shewanella surugensis]MCL1127805.1 CesT family type III secretion system chaperone [Shewanella surugensis]